MGCGGPLGATTPLSVPPYRTAGGGLEMGVWGKRTRRGGKDDFSVWLAEEGEK